MAAKKKRKSKAKPKKKTGPKTQRLRIDMDWIDAVKQSFTKKKPASGWPTPATE